MIRLPRAARARRSFALGAAAVSLVFLPPAQAVPSGEATATPPAVPVGLSSSPGGIEFCGPLDGCAFSIDPPRKAGYSVPSESCVHEGAECETREITPPQPRPLPEPAPTPTTVPPPPPPLPTPPTTTSTVPLDNPQPSPQPVGSVEQIIRDAAAEFGIDPDRFVRVCRCESRLDPTAYNPGGCEGAGCYGLTQQHGRYGPGRFAALGYSWEQWSEPVANARVGAALVASGGWGHYECA